MQLPEPYDLALRPLRLEPKPGESLLGYVGRLAEQELCTRIEMGQWIGLEHSFRYVLTPSEKTAALLGISRERLVRMGARTQAMCWVNDAEIPSRLVEQSYERICPACLREDDFHRGIWQLKSIDICPFHRTALTDRCPSCRQFLTSHRRSIDRCNCGVILREIPGSALDVGWLSASVVYRSFGVQANDVRVPETVGSLDPSNHLSLMRFLGQIEIERVRRERKPARGSAVHHRRILDAGAEIVLGWPDQFFELASRLRAASANLPTLRALLPIKDWLLINRETRAAKVLQDAYDSFFELRCGISDHEKRNICTVREHPSDFVCTGTAQLLLGLRRLSDFHLLTESALWEPIGRAARRKRDRLFFPAKAVYELAESREFLEQFRTRR